MTNSLESKEKLNPAQFNLDNLDLQHLYSIVWQRKRLLALITLIFLPYPFSSDHTVYATATEPQFALNRQSSSAGTRSK